MDIIIRPVGTAFVVAPLGNDTPQGRQVLGSLNELVTALGPIYCGTKGEPLVVVTQESLKELRDIAAKLNELEAELKAKMDSDEKLKAEVVAALDSMKSLQSEEPTQDE